MLIFVNKKAVLRWRKGAKKENSGKESPVKHKNFLCELNKRWVTISLRRVHCNSPDIIMVGVNKNKWNVLCSNYSVLFM